MPRPRTTYTLTFTPEQARRIESYAANHSLTPETFLEIMAIWNTPAKGGEAALYKHAARGLALWERLLKGDMPSREEVEQFIRLSRGEELPDDQAGGHAHG